ncbi:hypothetical protein PV327_004112 [Microctonus hyperodae]|uniref:5'-3' exoribonuclease 1 n=1 Tax=Microctonus hyperodae TaxID=165561 RepID=A0AA39FBS0_MICHY|nr:hypothetical protein PV327_004112 [Microctonus hyperodae]
MGVPKFARFICERYPCILELLNDYQIPEFDNLYLDMNGIIHCCSHPNDADAHFRITEETIFKNIFHYLEILFRTIKPQKLFFMAVDGVAPRAKINQQRSRRFRAAKEAELVEARARARGETISEESKFDSNCITPGTLFMAKLTEQLKYFVTYKVSTDKLWQKCQIILSGPEVPGEGEHKIMDYIRYLKSQPDHDANTRHCLYGLDADLIMLSLCTHEPHFTVLREEVKYGKNVQKCIMPEKTKFCLLHISLLREYMEHEFEVIKDKLSFPFDIEKIIDDWILMGFLVGNDFIPHLPNLHIANGALPLLYQAYMEILPTMDGYINEAGQLNLVRFEKFMERLAVTDVEHFTENLADLKYFEGKTGRLPNEIEQTRYNKLNEFEESPKNTRTISTSQSSPKIMNKDLNALIQMTDEILLGHLDEEEQLDTDSDNDMYNLEFLQHKRDYYMNKFEYENVDADVMRLQAEAYVTAIQWNLHYYYDGCCSWSWYYPHHYAPYISDIKGFKDLVFNFDLGEPFLPFQQLLAVLPAASKNLLPEVYQGLLTDEVSPIIDYYPDEFRTDLNEKKQEWEAVVLIPFINEVKLIDAMRPFNSRLTQEEINRNKHGDMHIIYYTEKNLGTIVAPEYFPTIESHAKMTTMSPKEIQVPRNKLIKGIAKNAKLHVYYSGFPTMQHIKHTAFLDKSKVKVFEHPSRDNNMIIKILPMNIPTIDQLANDVLGQIVYVRWPHLMEAHVIAVSNSAQKFTLIDSNSNHMENVRREEFNSLQTIQWNMEAKNIVSSYKNRFGIEVGEIKMIIHARPITGRRYILTSQGRLSLEKEWSNYPVSYAYQSIVRNIQVEDEGFIVHKNVADIYVPKSVCFMLGHPHYGAIGEVIAPGMNIKTGRVKVAMKFIPDPNFESLKREQSESRMQYMHGSIAAQRLGISSHLLSRITGSIFVLPRTNEQSERKQQNIGLNLKFNKKNEELPGYTKKVNGQWLYSSKSIGLIRNYMEKFPLLFEYLAQNISNDIYNEDGLFPERPQEIINISKWIKEQPFRSIEVRNCDWDGLDPEIIQKISIEIDKHLEQEADITKTVLMQVKPHLLYKPGLSAGNIAPDPKAKHKIFDRIIAIREDSVVPIGYRGTIVCIQSSGDDLDGSLYDILFDKSFIGSISFTGGATSRRHKLLAAEFINISHGIRAEQNITDVCSTPEKFYRKKNTINSENVPNLKSSAFASFNKHGDFLPVFCQKTQDHQQSQNQARIRVMKKNNDSLNSHNSPLKNNIKNDTSTQKAGIQPSEKQTQTLVTVATTATSTPATNPQSSKLDRTTEFQLLWNELHKLPQVEPDVTKKSMAFPTMLRPQPPIPSTTESHARQVNKKDNISYCALLLNHFQLIGNGLPRYFYTTDEKNLIRAQIVLPDMRNYQGDAYFNHALAAENAASIVYKELNLDKTTKLRPPFEALTRDTWMNIPPSNVQPSIPTHSFPDAKKPTVRLLPPNWNQLQSGSSQQSSKFPPTVLFGSGQIGAQPLLVENKRDEKQQHVTPFVPLQAQKKTRVRKSKETLQSLQLNVTDALSSKIPKAQKSKTTLQSKGSTKIVESDKATKINNITESKSDNSNQGQKIQKILRQRKSRIAANFGTSPITGTTNGSEAK